MLFHQNPVAGDGLLRQHPRGIATVDKILMATHRTPHLCNDLGVEKIHIGVKEFQCMGARPPLDHPHIYLDMGGDDHIVCPYCSTLYTYDPNIEPDQTDPPYCLYQDDTRKAG